MICLVFIYAGFGDDLLSLYKGGPEALLHEIVIFSTGLFFVGGANQKQKAATQRSVTADCEG
jgi:hypothetical protein